MCMARVNKITALSAKHQTNHSNGTHHTGADLINKLIAGDGESTTFLVGTGKDGAAFYLEGKHPDDFLPKIANPQMPAVTRIAAMTMMRNLDFCFVTMFDS